jgi:hypothetical protein
MSRRETPGPTVIGADLDAFTIEPGDRARLVCGSHVAFGSQRNAPTITARTHYADGSCGNTHGQVSRAHCVPDSPGQSLGVAVERRGPAAAGRTAAGHCEATQQHAGADSGHRAYRHLPPHGLLLPLGCVIVVTGQMMGGSSLGICSSRSWASTIRMSSGIPLSALCRGRRACSDQWVQCGASHGRRQLRRVCGCSAEHGRWQRLCSSR